MTFGCRYVASIIFCFALVVAISGCGNDPFPVQPVSGTVLHNGEPLAEATVTFVPREAGGRSASGVTLADGTLELTTAGATRKGALIGDYIVYISKEFPVDAQGRRTTFEAIEEATAHLEMHISRQPRMVSEIPARYSDARSPLQATVQRGQNSFVFELGN